MMIRRFFIYYLVLLSGIHTYGLKRQLIAINVRSALSATTVERSIILESDEITKEIEVVDKDSKSGLFRKISYSNKDFEFGEILTTNDVEEYQKRFQSLKDLFPLISEKSLRSMVFISPLLLALETESLQTSVRRLSNELPYVDPSYLIEQRSCGVDLLLACMAPSFNLELRRKDVVDVIDKRNVTDFLRRVPHSLTPRYLLALQDHCFILNDALGIDLKNALDIVERWPGILGIDLTKYLNRFQRSLKSLDLIATKDNETRIIANLMRTVPRCLMQDMPRRVHTLKQKFPGWDLSIIIQKYPRVLTQKIEGLVLHFETLQELLDPLDVDANKFVNSFPSGIGYDPNQILAAAKFAAAALPGSSVKDICSRAPRILLLKSKGQLLPKIMRLRRAFVKGETSSSDRFDTHGNRNSVKRSSTIEKNIADNGSIGDFTMNNKLGVDGLMSEKEEYMSISDTDLVDDESRIQMAQILARMGTTEADNLLAAKYSDVDYESRILYEDLDSDQEKEDKGMKMEKEKIMQVMLQLELASVRSPDMSGVDADTIRHLAAHVRNVGRQNSRETNDPNDLISTNDIQVNNNETSITRIIMGNLDLFIDNYPLFMHKTGGYIKDFGPVLAYTVLSAVPSLLVKKTATIQPILKMLYSLILETGRKPSINMDEINSPLQTIRENRPVYTALYILLMEAPKLMLKRPEKIDLKLQHLANIFEQNDLCSIGINLGSAKEKLSLRDSDFVKTSPSSSLTMLQRAKQMAVGAPRILLESKMERVLFRVRLLLHFMHRNSCSTDSHTNEKLNDDLKASSLLDSILLECPMILSSPSSVLARLYFTQKYLSRSSMEIEFYKGISAPETLVKESKASLTVAEVGRLLDCNPKTFITRLADLTNEANCLGVENSYRKFLKFLNLEQTLSFTPKIKEVSYIVSDHEFEAARTSKIITADQMIIDDIGNDFSSSDFKSETVGILELEMLLCGHFNNLTAAPDSEICENIDVMPSHGSKAGIADKKQTSASQIKAEIKRIDCVVQRIDQLLIDGCNSI